MDCEQREESQEGGGAGGEVDEGEEHTEKREAVNGPVVRRLEVTEDGQDGPRRVDGPLDDVGKGEDGVVTDELLCLAVGHEEGGEGEQR